MNSFCLNLSVNLPWALVLREPGPGDHWIELASSTNAAGGGSEIGSPPAPQPPHPPPGEAEQRSGRRQPHWLGPFGKRTNLSELPFGILTGVAGSKLMS